MRLLPVIALACSSAFASEAPQLWQPAPPAFEPVIGGSAFGGSGAAEGTLFSLLPLHAGSDSVLYLEPHFGWQEGGIYDASLGLGFRKLFGDPTDGRSKLAEGIDLLGEGWYLGGNLFADGLHGAHDLNHWQLSTGVEIGSRYLSLHANYYWPLTGAKRWGQTSTTEIISRNQAAKYELHVGPEITSGPLMGTHQTQVTVAPYETFREKLTTYGLYDAAQAGWDTELSMLMPVVDKYVDFRLVAGLYGFDGGSTGRGFQGWQLGAEFRPVPSVVLMATRFDDDRFRKGQWLAGVRIEIPLGTKSGDGFRIRERSLSERLMEPAKRRNAPTVGSGTVREKVVFQTTDPVSTGPTSIVGLQLDRVPNPGDIIVFPSGAVFAVQSDGQTLRPYKGNGRGLDISRFLSSGAIVITPEPSRLMLLLLGLAAILSRRRRT